MKHRERVMMALSRETPDRCPMQISFTPEFAARLRADLALNDRVSPMFSQGDGLTMSADRAGHNPHGGGNTYELERALGEDMLLLLPGGGRLHRRVGHRVARGAV